MAITARKGSKRPRRREFARYMAEVHRRWRINEARGWWLRYDEANPPPVPYVILDHRRHLKPPLYHEELMPEVEEWLKLSVPDYRMASYTTVEYSDFMKEHINILHDIVLFPTAEEAALFKVFWC